MTQEEFDALLKQVQPETAFDLTEEAVYSISNEQWLEFLKALAKNKADLKLTGYKAWVAIFFVGGYFRASLANSGVKTTIDLTNAHLGSAAHYDFAGSWWKDSFQDLAKGNAKSLILDRNFLCDMLNTAGRWAGFCEGISQSTIETLSLCDNGLKLMNDEERTLLFKAFAKSQIKTLRLFNPNERKPPTSWYERIIAIEEDPLNNAFTSKQYQELYDLLNTEGNTRLTTIITDDKKVNKQFAERISKKDYAKFAPTALALTGNSKDLKIPIFNPDMVRNVLEFVEDIDKEALNILNKLLQQDRARLKCYLFYNTYIKELPSLTFELIQDSNDPGKAKTTSLLSIQLTSKACIDLLRDIINMPKWDNKGYTLWGTKTPEGIKQLRILLNNEELLLSPAKIEAGIKNIILDEDQLSTIAWLVESAKEYFKIRHKDMIALRLFINHGFLPLLQKEIKKESEPSQEPLGVNLTFKKRED